MAHLGRADALFETQKYREAVDSYNTAIALLEKDKCPADNKTSSEAENTGKRFFSYQNQGLEFPHGLDAYLYLRRGIALKEMAGRDTEHYQELVSKAMADYDHAIALAPNYEEAIVQRNSLQQQSRKQ